MVGYEEENRKKKARIVEISQASNGPGRKELTAEEVIKKQQQRLKKRKVEEKKDEFKASSRIFKNNNDKHLENPKNAQDFHPEKSENLRHEKDLQSSAGRRNRKDSKEHLYSAIPRSNIGRDDSYIDKHHIFYDNPRIHKRISREFKKAPEPSTISLMQIYQDWFSRMFLQFSFMHSLYSLQVQSSTCCYLFFSMLPFVFFPS